eukprot:2451814-Rhodomonas_salina.4
MAVNTLRFENIVSKPAGVARPQRKTVEAAREQAEQRVSCLDWREGEENGLESLRVRPRHIYCMCVSKQRLVVSIMKNAAAWRGCKYVETEKEVEKITGNRGGKGMVNDGRSRSREAKRN